MQFQIWLKGKLPEDVDSNDARTTMIYTHTVRSRTVKEATSPLDFSDDVVKTLEGFDGRVLS